MPSVSDESSAQVMDRAEPLLSIRNLSLEFPTYRGTVHALGGISLDVVPGEVTALVGESGSGKSVAAMAAIGLLPVNICRITAGSVSLLGRDVLRLPARTVNGLRGKLMSMVFQEPATALNPTLRIGRQMSEVLRRHEGINQKAALLRAAQLLAEMQVPDPARVLRGYPFELSGGMRQRVLLAMAFACNPRLLIADEPTTALDVTVQAQVLALIRERARARGTAVLFITHDLAVVTQLCSQVYVMYAGQIVERGSTAAVLRSPRHPYTRALLRSLPESSAPGVPLHSIPGTVPSLLDPPRGCRFAARCPQRQDQCEAPPPLAAAADLPDRASACWFPLAAEDPPRAAVRASAADPAALSPVVERAYAPPLVSIEAAEVRFPVGSRWGGEPAAMVHALNGVDLQIFRGETLAVVGESGCGKSTLAQLVMSLLQPNEGRVWFDGADLNTLAPERRRVTRRRLQMVFQDPQGSLDPRMPVWRIICEPLEVAGNLDRATLRRRAAELAALVGLREDQLQRYPHEFSGGQRQRIAIARALALEPELLVLDEPTSALDVSIQAQILNLLLQLQARLGLTYLYISHNVSVVRHMAGRVAVMFLGQVVELGSSAQILEDPRHPYTRQLIGAVPRLDRPLAVPDPALAEPRSNLQLPSGCFFRSRCSQSNAACAEPQHLRALPDGRQVRCQRA